MFRVGDRVKYKAKTVFSLSEMEGKAGVIISFPERDRAAVRFDGGYELPYACFSNLERVIPATLFEQDVQAYIDAEFKELRHV